MSDPVYIGRVFGPDPTSGPSVAADVRCSPDRVELDLHENIQDVLRDGYLSRQLNPVAARNLAALLVRAADEAERMVAREQGTKT